MAKKMSPVRRAELKKILQDRRDQLQGEIDTQRREFKEQETSFADVMDAASDVAAGDIDSALSGQKNQTLIKITDALARLEQGEYGNCTDCGEEIAEKRLRAVPFAVRCTSCEEMREKAEKE